MALRPSAAACSSVCPAPSIAWAVAAVAMATSFCHPSLNTGCDSARPDLPPVAVTLDDQVRPALRVAANG